MPALARTGLKLGGIFLALVVIFYCALYFIIQSAPFRPWIEAKLSTASGATVRVTDLRFRLPLSIVAEDMEVSKPDIFFFKGHRLTATLNPFDLRSGTVHRLDIASPLIELDIQGLSRPANKKSATLALRHLNVRDGRIVLKKGDTVLLELPAVTLNAQNFNLADHAGVSLQADIPELNGNLDFTLAGQLDALQADLAVRSKTRRGLLGGAESDPAAPEMLRLRSLINLAENQRPAATIESQWHDLPIQTTKITGVLNAKLDIEPDFSAVAFTGRAELVDVFSALVPALSRLPHGKAAATFSGAYATASKKLTLKTVDITSALGSAKGDGEMLFTEQQPTVAKAALLFQDIPLQDLKTLLPSPFNQWTYQGRGRVEVEVHGAWNALAVKGVARSNGTQIRGADLALENLSLNAPFEWSRPTWRIGEAQLTALKLTYGDKDRWQVAAERVQASATMNFGADPAMKITGRLTSAGGKFASPDGSKLGENFAIDGDFELRTDPVKHSIGVGGKFRADAGELLWGKFFADLKMQQPVIELQADYFRDLDRFDCRRCNFNLTKIGSVDVSGSVEGFSQSPKLRLQARSANFLPGGFYEFVLRSSFNREYPLLDKLTLGGELAFQCQIHGDLQSLITEGDLSLKAGELREEPEGLQIGPITLNLPFQISWLGSPQASSAKPQIGVLAIEQARFGGQSVGRITAAISLSNNALIFPQPIHAEIFGGAVEISALRWPDVVNNPKQLSFSAEMKRLQLDDLSRALHWPPFSGTLTGSIPQVQSVGNTLQTNGEIQAELFGGQVRLGKLEIENPFSSLAAIQLDARLSGIDLEQVTKTFSFGRISGILEGSIDDLVITDKQPSQFRADLHSVDRGTEQRISVEALNKITVLSSGASAGALYSGLAGFFDSFRYSKLGFKASLKNDRLTLRGVESQGDQEFLVVGSLLPPRVNIVSHTQNIAFSELLRRLQQIKSDKPETK